MGNLANWGDATKSSPFAAKGDLFPATGPAYHHGDFEARTQTRPHLRGPKGRYEGVPTDFLG